MRRTLSVAVVALAAVSSGLLVRTSWAQVSTATLVVETAVGEDLPLPGVTVVATNRDTGLDRRGVTDAAGRAFLLALPPGSYEVTAELAGFESATAPESVLRVGQTAHLRLTMRPLVTETLEVRGEAPLVDVNRTDSSTNIVPEQIRDMPIPDRQFENLTFLTPGVARERLQWLNLARTPVLGSTPTAQFTGYLVDGADAIDSFYGLTRVTVSPDAVREMRVVTGLFDAEVGGVAAGAVLVVTRSGTNTLHGSAYGFYRADALRSRGALESEQAEYSRSHLGVTLGGPLVRGRTHYFLSAEHIDESNIVLVRPGGAFAGVADDDVTNPVVQTMALVSLDHRFGDSSTGTLKLTADRLRQDNFQVGDVRAESTGFSYDRDNWNLLLGHTWVIGDNLLNELRVQWGAGDGAFPANGTEMAEWFTFGSTYQRGSNYLLGRGADIGTGTGEVRGTLHLLGSTRHRLKVGLSYQRVRWEYPEDRYGFGLMVYGDDARALPLLYYYGIGSALADLSNDYWGAFVHLDWRLRDNLSVSLGLRYDLETDGNNRGFTHPLVGERDRDTDNLQPRLGISWDLRGDGRDVLRVAAGRYVGRFFLLGPAYELMFNGETGRLLRRNASVPELGVWLDPSDPESTGYPLPPDIQLLADDLEAPESLQASLGFSHRLGDSGLTLDLEGVWIDGENLMVGYDSNWAGNDNPGRIDPDYTEIVRYTGEGRAEYRSLRVGLNGTLAGGHVVTASVALVDSKNHGIVWPGIGSPSDPADLEAEWGPSWTDQRYRLVVSGVFRLPWGVTVAPFYEYGSGVPWNRVYGYDFNGDGAFDDRPEGVGRNDQDGPPFRQLNLRISKAFALGQGELELIVEGFNVFNTTNYDVTSVVNAMTVFDPVQFAYVPNPAFGTYTATHPPREIQLGLRYSF
jgi:hypothetical protein